MSSDSDSSPDDTLYTEHSVFSEDLYRSLVSDLTSRPHCTRIRPSGLKLFQSLGVNVTRLLLTYFSLPDFLRVTTVCKWFYRVGNDPEALAVYVPHETVPGLDIGEARVAFTEKYRDTALRNKAKPLHKDVVFTTEYTSVIGVKTIAARLVLFSLYEDRLYVWECSEGEGRTIGVYTGVKDAVGWWVGEDGAALIGTNRLVYIESRWVSSGADERTTHTLDFPTEAFQASVHKLHRFPFIALSRNATVTVYTVDLEAVRVIELTEAEVICGKLCAPRVNRPVVVFATPSKCVVLDVTSGKATVHNSPPVEYVEKVDILTLPSTSPPRDYLFIQGFQQDSFYLYSNSSLLVTNVNTFYVHASSLLVFVRPYKFNVYSASVASILLTHTVTLPTITFGFLLHSHSKLVGVQSTQTEKYLHAWPRRGYQTKIWFADASGAVIVTDVLSDVYVDTAYATRNEVVVVGLHSSGKLRSVVIVRYLRDGKEDGVVAERYERYVKGQEGGWVAVSEEERYARVMEWRKIRREDKWKKRERERLRKTKYWKQKQGEQEQVWLEVRNSCREK